MTDSRADSLPDIAALFPPATAAEWRARAAAALKGADVDRRLLWRTRDGLEIAALHGERRDAAPVLLPEPGRGWRTAARVDHPDAEAAAAQAIEDLEGGADMLTLAFRGGRSARGFGLSWTTLADLDAALAGVRLDLIRLRLDPAPGGRLNALALAALVERRKLDPSLARIDFGLDPIGTLLTLGRTPWDWAAGAARLAQTAKALAARGFPGPFATVDLRPFHEAGATEGQELAAALAAGVLYVRALEAHGVPVAEAFRMVSFVVPLDADQFMGIAKLRALRRLWAHVARASEQEPRPAVVHAETSWRMLARRDAHGNILRATIAAFAAAAGGADTLTVLPFTAAQGLPDPLARRLARNTSLVLQEEAYLAKVQDPAAGAGAVEALTDALAAKAWALFQEIEGEGGLVVSLVLGKLQARIAEAANARARDVATRREPILGVSLHPNLDETPPAVLPLKPERRAPAPKPGRGRAAGTAEAAIAALLAGAPAARLQPPADGELMAEPLVSRRLAEPWEALRDRADAFLKRRRRRPAVTLATLGPLADHGPRLQFMEGLFAAAGLLVETAEAGEVPDAASFVCLVGTDAAYAAEGARTLRRLRRKGRALLVAGRPAEIEEPLRKAGAKRLVALGDDMLAVLGEALAIAGA